MKRIDLFIPGRIEAVHEQTLKQTASLYAGLIETLGDFEDKKTRELTQQVQKGLHAIEAEQTRRGARSA